MGLNPYAVIAVHFIGVFITLVIFYKTGEFEDAAKHGDGRLIATPSDLVLQALFWEFLLFIIIPGSIEIAIDDFFRKKYCKEEKCKCDIVEEKSCSDSSIDQQEILNKLYSIIIELDARENTNNCVVVGLLDKGWTELCEEAIELLGQIK